MADIVAGGERWHENFLQRGPQVMPPAAFAAIAAGARQGVLFRGGAAVEQLAAIDIVAMDKTGTLTTGELRVESVESFPPGRELEVGDGYALISASPSSWHVVRAV